MQAYFEYSPKGGSETKIYVDVEEIRESAANKLIEVNKPVASESKQNSTDPQTKIKDIKRISHHIYVRGYISAQTAVIDGTPTSISAIQAKIYFFDKIFWRGYSTGNQVKFYYWGGSYSGDNKNTGNVDPSTRYELVFINKVEFKDVSKRGPGQYGSYYDVQRYEVQFDLVRGTPL